MSELIVKPVGSDEEYDIAYELALSVFAPHSSMGSYADHKHHIWTRDPFADQKNILLAWYDHKPAGLVRIVPRIFYRHEKTFAVAGISSVCIIPELRGRGFSTPLMHRAIEYSRERGFDVNFLFARRAADHYYTQFGFHGIASYARVLIKKPVNENGGIKLSLTGIDEGHIDLYAAAYEHAYQKCFGRVQRTEGYWKFLVASIRLREDCFFHTLAIDTIPAGYIIWNKKKILEIACVTDIPGRELVPFLMRELSIEYTDDRIELEMLPQHNMIPLFEGLDIIFQSRECSYGGHMIHILDPASLVKKIANSSTLPAADIGHIKSEKELTFRETCELLGIFSPTLGDDGFKQGLLPFDVCSIDHF